MPRRQTHDPDAPSASDIGLGVLFMGTGAAVTFLTLLAMRQGHGWLFLLLGIGGFLVGPILVLIGISALVRGVWSLRPRGYREVIDDTTPPGDDDSF